MDFIKENYDNIELIKRFLRDTLPSVESLDDIDLFGDNKAVCLTNKTIKYLNLKFPRTYEKGSVLICKSHRLKQGGKKMYVNMRYVISDIREDLIEFEDGFTLKKSYVEKAFLHEYAMTDCSAQGMTLDNNDYKIYQFVFFDVIAYFETHASLLAGVVLQVLFW